jgi:hypothetical protein
MNARHEFSWTAADRAHELQGEADDDFDARLAEGTKRQIAAIRTNALVGHQQTLESLAEGLAHRLSGSGVTELLVRAVLVNGPLGAGQMLLDLINKSIAADAETAALVELDRAERASGLDFAAMRAAAPELRVPA